MSDTKQKPDGWVAYHRKELPIPNEIMRLERHVWAGLLGYIDPYTTSWGMIERDDEYAKAQKEGWSVRPVKLVFLDEGEK